MRVALLPTGRSELNGLPLAFKALFPEHDFYSIAKRPLDGEPFDGFTSCVVGSDDKGNVDTIVQAMAAGLLPGRNGDPPDLVFVVEDLELANKLQPGVVIDAFRNAVLRHIAKLRHEVGDKLADRVEGALLEKASFHLAVPMMEAWLFADPNGPSNAGVPAPRLPPNWQSTQDPESFSTLDPDYLADSGAACAKWSSLPAKRAKGHKPLWLRGAQRGEHPKAFLAWLSREPGELSCTRYRETHEGAAALAALAWAAALSNPNHCTYLRAMVDDLAAALGEASPGEGNASPLTDHRARRARPVLRNI